MTRHSLGGVLVLSIVSASLAVSVGCEGTEGSTTTGPATPPPGAPAPEGGAGVDGGEGGACTGGLPAAGLQNLVKGDESGRHAAIVLDDQGAPIVAHARMIAAESVAIELVRWDASCGRWGAPITVDTVSSQTDNGRQIALAFDKSNGSVGIAYQAIVGALNGDHHYELRFAVLAKGAAKVSTPERVEDPKDNDHAPSTPGLAMANGKVFAGYVEQYRICNTSNCGAVVYRTKDGATWGAEIVLPGAGDFPAYGSARDAEVSIAVDSAGNPAVAYAMTLNDAQLRTQAVLYVRPGAATAAEVIANTDGTGTDSPHVALAFDGTRPRIAAIINVNANYSVDGHTEWFIPSNDDTAWGPAVPMPHDMNSSLDLDVSLAIGPGGKVAIVSSSNLSDGSNVFGTPKILTSTDLASFTVGGVAKATYDGGARWAAAAYGADGKLQIAMRGPAMSDATKVGLLYYREP